VWKNKGHKRDVELGEMFQYRIPEVMGE